MFLQKGIRVKKRHHIFINEAIFGCDCLSIVNLTAVKYFARILFMLYGPPMKFCTRVDEFEQKNVYAIEEQCFYTEDGKVGAENGWTKLEESEKLGNKSWMENTAGKTCEKSNHNLINWINWLIIMIYKNFCKK